MTKFMYNGIKVNDQLFKVQYSTGGYKTVGTIAIYSREYKRLPHISGLQIENDSDSMTDYFEKDSIYVEPTNIHYEAIAEAYAKQEAHNLKRYNKRMGVA